MSDTTITNFRKHIFDYVKAVIDFNETINVSTKDGSAVLISKEDYNALIETIYIMNIPGMLERIIEAKNTPIEECEEFAW